jgi:hypothetical protein
MSWKHIEQHELLSDETILVEKMAGAFIKLSDYNLRSLSYLNWGGTEKIGGKLHLTNYRLIFASTSLNRVAGKFSIFLPTVQGIKNTSFLLDRRIEISTQSQIFEFQVWGIPEFVERILSTRDSIDAEKKEQLVGKITREYPVLGEDFKTHDSALKTIVEGAASVAEVFDHLAPGGNPLRKMLNSASPPTVSSVLNLLDVLGKK